MKQTLAFTEGVGAGAGAILIIGALLLLTRGRVPGSFGRRFGRIPRCGRTPVTAPPPPNYLDVCRTAGL